MNNLKEKYTVITGASSGIGYAVAKKFAKENKNLILIARRESKLEQLKSEILGEYPHLKIIIKICDLSISQNIYDIYSSLKQYHIETFINNAGFGYYTNIADQDLDKVENMINLNITALTIFSSLYVNDYKNIAGSQLINISSAGGYTLVPNAVSYCATKFYVSAFTEGLARELETSNSELKAKVLAPAATKTEFGNVANNTNNYDYDTAFSNYHTSDQMADFLFELYNSDQTIGLIDRSSFNFKLSSTHFPYAGGSSNNQNIK